MVTESTDLAGLSFLCTALTHEKGFILSLNEDLMSDKMVKERNKVQSKKEMEKKEGI